MTPQKPIGDLGWEAAAQEQLKKDMQRLKEIEELVPFDVVWDIVLKRYEKLPDYDICFPEPKDIIEEMLSEFPYNIEETEEAQEFLEELTELKKKTSQSTTLDFDLFLIENEIDSLIADFVIMWVENISIVFEELFKGEICYLDENFFPAPDETTDRVLEELCFNNFKETFAQIFDANELEKVLEGFGTRIRKEIDRDGKFDLVDRLVIYKGMLGYYAA